MSAVSDLSSTEVALDTNAIRKLLVVKDLDELQKRLRKIREKCPTIIVPPLRSEIRCHIPTFLQFRLKILRELRGKFVDYHNKTFPCHQVKSVEPKLRKCGMGKNDLTVVEVALRRRRKTSRKVIICSDDPDFKRCTQVLSKLGLDVSNVNGILSQINDC